MLMVCHHLNPAIPEDLAFAESRIRPVDHRGGGRLHDLGAISMIGSDSQAMGRVGEVVLRTWQTAHVMKVRRGSLPGDGAADNNRARRYVAKYTICPAVAHGLASEIGSVEVGKARRPRAVGPAFFGVRPHVVLRRAASSPGPRWVTPTRRSRRRSRRCPARCSVLPPRRRRPSSVNFVAPLALLESDLADRVGIKQAAGRRRRLPVAHQGRHGENAARPDVRVRPDTFAVTIDASSSRRPPPPSCPWRSATSCSDVDGDVGDAVAGGWAAAGGRPCFTRAAIEAAIVDGRVYDLATLESFLVGRLATTAPPRRRSRPPQHGRWPARTDVHDLLVELDAEARPGCWRSRCGWRRGVSDGSSPAWQGGAGRTRFSVALATAAPEGAHQPIAALVPPGGSGQSACPRWPTWPCTTP